MAPNEVTYNNMPEAIAQILTDNLALRQQVVELFTIVNSKEGGKEVLDLEQAASFINKSPKALYGMVHRREIRFYKPDKNLQFLRSDLLDWVINGKQDAAAGEVKAVRKNVVTINKK